MQSGHGSGHDVPVWEWVRRDVALLPPKPTLDLEPNYEDHLVNPWPQWNPTNGFFRDDDVRRAVFAGACGTTYGHHAVWQFASVRGPVINHADMGWRLAMQRPAARQMSYLRQLMLSRPFFGRVEAPEMLPAGSSDDPSRQAIATRSEDRSYAFIFFPQARQRIEIDFAAVRGPRRAWWFDPQAGMAEKTALPNTKTLILMTAPNGVADAVLVVDCVDRNFPSPGLLQGRMS
ncbi:hypothetical protein HDF08_000058 [Edaphobacter lichenicola]|uniref:DUF4038 domain-containing protein n=3 Tax=Tunturiibacter TaxID=3154218 RepID=A0A852V9I4_9BACT|nr:hypothetical protein [Edaphobacter lichenicola]